MRILVTNDDGVRAPGLLALAEGYVSVTPLQLDLTAYAAAGDLPVWEWHEAHRIADARPPAITER